MLGAKLCSQTYEICLIEARLCTNVGTLVVKMVREHPSVKSILVYSLYLR